MLILNDIAWIQGRRSKGSTEFIGVDDESFVVNFPEINVENIDQREIFCLAILPTGEYGHGRCRVQKPYLCQYEPFQGKQFDHSALGHILGGHHLYMNLCVSIHVSVTNLFVRPPSCLFVTPPVDAFCSYLSC